MTMLTEDAARDYVKAKCLEYEGVKRVRTAVIGEEESAGEPVILVQALVEGVDENGKAYEYKDVWGVWIDFGSIYGEC